MSTGFQELNDCMLRDSSSACDSVSGDSTTAPRRGSLLPHRERAVFALTENAVLYFGTTVVLQRGRAEACARQGTRCSVFANVLKLRKMFWMFHISETQRTFRFLNGKALVTVLFSRKTVSDKAGSFEKQKVRRETLSWRDIYVQLNI